jgi:uncharacterized protein (TIGR02594 family)
MATFVIIKSVFLFEKAPPPSKKLGTVLRDTEVKGDLRDNGFIETSEPVKIKKDDGSFDTATGFMLFLDFARKALEEPIPIVKEDHATVCGLVTDAARAAATDRDYLLATAYVLSKNLSDVGTGKGRAGPFGFTAEMWKNAIDTGPAKNLGILQEDRLRWYEQPRVAAALTAAQAKKLKGDLGDKGPKYPELFFVQLLGDTATEILTKKLDDKVDAAIDAAALDPALTAELKKAPLTVENVLAKLQTLLDDAYDEARKVIDLQPPDVKFFRAHENDSPWMAVAREEMSAGVSEDTNSRNTPEIDAYFTAINAQPGGATPWCGAFVGYCVKKCGVDAIASTVKPEAVSTTFWQNKWGDAVAKPFPIGSIVVLKPDNSDGHVGFLAEGSTDDVICILGGNQGNPGHVSIAKFPVANIIVVKSMPFAAPETAVVVDPARLAQAPADIQKTLPMAQRAFSRLRAAGWTPAQACGILANIQAESKFNFKDTTGDGNQAHGLCQWHKDRRDIFDQNFPRPFAQSTFEDQLDFITFEMNHNEKDAGKTLKKATTPSAAADTVCRDYERPEKKDKDSAIRMPIAETYAHLFK